MNPTPRCVVYQPIGLVSCEPQRGVWGTDSVDFLNREDMNMNINDEKWFNKDYLNGLTEEQAVGIIERVTYEACHLFERLEGVGKVRGNGHHMMQAISTEAGKLMRERWIKTPNVEFSGTPAALRAGLGTQED